MDILLLSFNTFCARAYTARDNPGRQRPSKSPAASVRQRTECLRRKEDHRSANRQVCAKEIVMNISLSLAPLISLLAGILILIVPRMLNYIVAAYLIVFGILGLFGDVRLT
jgi:hypothetical protein